MRVVVKPDKGGSEFEIRDPRVLAEVVRVLNDTLAEANGIEIPKRGPGRPPKVQPVAADGVNGETQGEESPA
jgi:hypothetical protein